jgi:hypothetical protein
MPAAGDAPPELARRFLLLALLAGLGLVLLAAGFVALVDPYGSLGTGLFTTAVPQDPQAKAQLIAGLDRPPQIVVLGSSRSMGITPWYVEKRTGLATFNAGVRGGGTFDAWALSNFVHDRYPAAHTRYLWLLDDFAFFETGVPLNEARSKLLNRYFPRSQRRGHRLPSVSLWRLVSLTGLEDSWRVVQARIEHRHPPRFKADGSWRLAPGEDDPVLTPGATTPIRVARTLAYYRRLYRTHSHVTAIAERYFRRTVAAMHRWHAPTVVVFPPVHPTLYRVLGPVGWVRAHREILAYVQRLGRRYGFQVIDETLPQTIGVGTRDFKDGTHLNQLGLRKLVDATVQKSHGAL